MSFRFASSVRDRWVDLVLASCLVGVAVVNGITVATRETPGNTGPSAWWEWAVLVAPAVPVAFRRSHPLAATPLSVAGQMIVWATDLASPFFAPLLMIYTVAAEAGRRGRLVAAASSVALSATALLGVFIAPDVTADLFFLTVLACLAMYVLGANVADQRQQGERLAAELAVAELEREAEHERAVTGERQRLARELHDIVGHSLSVIAVRSEAAARVAPKNPGAAVEAVDAVAVTARSSLAEVRRVLAGLRPDDPTAELAPVASLGAIPPLLRSIEAAGLNVELTTELPDQDAVGPVVGVSAYRIVQEALTNVIRHGGPGVNVRLALELEGGRLAVRVDDDGRGPDPGGTDGVQSAGRGTGITGMRERVEVLGGTLATGPRPGGGFRVEASLPIEAPPIARSAPSGSGAAAGADNRADRGPGR